MERVNRTSVPALQRGLTIIEALAKSRGGLTLSQITRYLDLPKSSVYCLLRTLEDSGYLYREPDSGKYRVSLRVCSLAQMALNGISIREVARPHLRRLAESTHLTVHLGVLEQNACILIEKVSPPDALRVATWVGKHLSLHCTSLGKALAAYLPEEQLDALVREQGLLKHNDNTICSLKRLKLELAAVRDHGYAFDDEEEEIGVRCLGAPVLNSRREAVAAISVVATTTELHSGNLEAIARPVIAAAREIGEAARAHAGQDATTSSSPAPGAPAPTSLAVPR